MGAMFYHKAVGLGVAWVIGVCTLTPGCCLFKKEKISNPFDGPTPVAAESLTIADPTCPAGSSVQNPPASNCPVNGPVNGPISTGPATYPAPSAPISQPASISPSGSQPASVSVIIPENETVPGGSVSNNNAVSNDNAAAKDSTADSADALADAPTDSLSDGPIRPVGATEGEASISNGSYQETENDGKSDDSENDLLSDPRSDTESGPKSMEKTDLPSGFNDYSNSTGAQSPYQNVSRPTTEAPATDATTGTNTDAANADKVNTPNVSEQSESLPSDAAAVTQSAGDSSQIPTTGAVEIPVFKRPSNDPSGSLGLPQRSNRAQFRVVAE